MKLHDLKPAPGSRRPRTRVGRGIAAGQGKTAGRGTKGQKSRAGVSIPGWFEGGQTPIHVRVPKLRGFKNRFRIAYAVINVGQISAYAEAGRFGVEAEQPKAAKSKSGEQQVTTVNAEVLANAGLIRGGDKPLKVLGQGEVSQKLFVAAQAFSASARRKIEEAGGFVQMLDQLSEPEQVAEVEFERELGVCAQGNGQDRPNKGRRRVNRAGGSRHRERRSRRPGDTSQGVGRRVRGDRRRQAGGQATASRRKE